MNYLFVVLTILKNMSSSMGRMTSHIWNGNKIHVPNHQPDYINPSLQMVNPYSIILVRPPWFSYDWVIPSYIILRPGGLYIDMSHDCWVLSLPGCATTVLFTAIFPSRRLSERCGPMAITSPGTAVFGTFGTEVAAILALPAGNLT